MFKKFSRLMLLVILGGSLAWCASGAVGSISAVSMSSTVRGLQAAVAGRPGTFMFTDGKLLLAAWSSGLKWSFVVLNTNGKPVEDFITQACGNGNRTCAESMSDLVQWMEGNGWKWIGPASVPVAIQEGLQAFSAWLTSTSSCWYSPIVLPVGDWMTPPWGGGGVRQ